VDLKITIESRPICTEMVHLFWMGLYNVATGIKLDHFWKREANGSSMNSKLQVSGAEEELDSLLG